MDKQQSDPQSNVAWWIQILIQYPWILWGSIWTLLLLLTGFAIAGLMNPALSSRDMPTTETAEAPTLLLPQRSESHGDSDPLPLWSVGAIAASCGIGSFILSRRLQNAQIVKQSPSLRRQSKTDAERSPAEQPTDITLSTYVSLLPPIVVPPSHPAALQPNQASGALPVSNSQIRIASLPEHPALNWQSGHAIDRIDAEHHQLSAWLRNRKGQ